MPATSTFTVSFLHVPVASLKLRETLSARFLPARTPSERSTPSSTCSVASSHSDGAAGSRTKMKRGLRA